MNQTQKPKGWKILVFALFLGPFFLAQYFRDTRHIYPAARYFAWLSLLALALSACLMFTFTFSPFILRMGYLIVFLFIFGLVFFYCWGIDAKTSSQPPIAKHRYSFSRACVWMIVMGLVFLGLNNLIQAIYFWLLGEQLSVYFSARANAFKFWIPVGLIYGFFYGLRTDNNYADRDPGAVVKSIFFIFAFISLYNGFVLALIVYPLQRLAPISYNPQLSEILFYILLLTTIILSATYLLGTAGRRGTLKSSGIFIVGIPLIALHLIVLSTYTVTINLVIASILEDRQQISSAKTLYAKAIPYIRYDNLLASLYHRQGVLHVLNQDHESAIASFKKVLTDYSGHYDVFSKARRYMDAFERNRSKEKLGRKILVVRHKTFEQAASCFPNSLSVILNFYEKQPISTRKLSYAIKESFSSGTFIWKAESFLKENGYELLTTYWQSKKTLISLLEAGYPILVYIPGHVYTVYGYDSRVEMFFTYDTAQSNRWNDKPFWSLQRDWMVGSFLMSVVIPKEEKENFVARFPQFDRYGDSYQLWQKAHISDYYESKGNYWKDYDRYNLSENFGIDRLKMNESYFLHDGFFPLRWDAEDWKNEVLPVLSQPWALDWSIMEKYILYLIYNGQPKQALDVIDLYESHLSEEHGYHHQGILDLKLAAAVYTKDQDRVLSVSDKLIGIAENMRSASYWGHYFKARHLMANGNLLSASEILLSALKNIRLGAHSRSTCFRNIVDALNEIYLMDPSLIAPENVRLMEVAQVDLALKR